MSNNSLNKPVLVNYYSYHCNEIISDIGTMRSKNISTQSNELLTYFNGIEKALL
jgi:hypothetical protein